MSPDPRDMLPQPPWEGPPIPRVVMKAKSRKLYHATPAENVSRILKEGLRPSTEHGGAPIKPGVYLATSPFWACMYSGTGTLLEITIPDPALLKKPRWAQDHERVYYGEISPESIKVLGDCEEFLR